MQKLILKCHLSPGDVVMLTAAVRDLHRAHPGKFVTDVRTPARELWENNPHITPLDEREGDLQDAANWGPARPVGLHKIRRSGARGPSGHSHRGPSSEV